MATIDKFKADEWVTWGSQNVAYRVRAVVPVGGRSYTGVAFISDDPVSDRRLLDEWEHILYNPDEPDDPAEVLHCVDIPVEETGGIKHDSGKTRLELIPPELLTGLGDVLTFGAEKYAARNWELGMDWDRVFGALQRHLWAWWGGQDLDPETGMSHLNHAAACVTFLLTYEARGIGTDNRHKT